MGNGLGKLLAAAIWFGSFGTGMAYGPVLLPLPDLTIGDMEDYVGTDNNYFVFTNAFEFDRYALTDCGTSLTALLWSFDEHNSDLTAGQQWFTVNGRDPVHVGDDAMEADKPVPHPDHVRPDLAGKDLRSVNPYATFRNIIFSPGTSVPPPAFPDPLEPAATDHATGKMLRFYVSDGSSVSSREVRVNTIDNGWDSMSSGCPFYPQQSDDFTTDVTNFTAGGTTGWVPLNVAVQTGQVTDYDSANTALRVTIASGSAIRINGWQTGNSEWLPYTSIMPGSIVRGEFHVFRANQVDMNNFNQIPNMRFRLSQRFAVTSMLEVFHHAPTEPLSVQQLAWELRPSSNPAGPSRYLVDIDPIDVPQMGVMAQPPYPEGISRAFEAYSLEHAENGSIELAESVTGSYRNLVDPADPGYVVNAKSYRTSPSDAGDLRVLNSSSEGAFCRLFVLLGAGGQLGTEIVPLPSTGAPTYAESSAGITLDSTAVASDRFALVVRDFAENLGENWERFRLSPQRQYLYRFHVTSTTNSNTNPMLRLRAFSVKFQWAQKLEIGGALAAGSINNLIAAQALPGNGCLNPDKDGTENGGYYNLILHSPMDYWIQPSQPYLAAQPGPCDPLPVTGVSRRDIKFGIDLLDTISGMAQSGNERGNFRLDKVDVYETPVAY